MSYETEHKWDGIAAKLDNCIKCGRPAGNTVFIVCNDCWPKSDVSEKLKQEEAWCKKFREEVWLADRLADYVRMHFEANPPMPETIAVPWRDYQQARGRTPNESR